MGRWASTANQTTAAASSLQFVVLVSLDFASGFVRAHDGVGNLTHAGQVYYGVGQFGGIEIDTEDLDVSARGAKLTLTGIPADLAPDILAETAYQNRPAVLYIGLLDIGTGAWVDTPEVLWEGLLDYMEIGGGEGKIQAVVYVEDELRREPRQAWNTDEDQRARYPGDRFFSDLPNVETSRATWGQKPVSKALPRGKLGKIARGVGRGG
jgi:hypothetical protein